MRHIVPPAFVLALFLAPSAVMAAPEAFAIDPVHTRVMIAVGHAGFSQALGTVSGATGQVRFADDWSVASVEVRIPLARLDFGDAGWNRAVQGLLDTGRYPEARFVAQRVTRRDAQHAEACGDFSLHGVTRPLCLDVTLNALRWHPLPPFRRTAGFSATTRLDRTAFGIDEWSSVIGRDVDVRIELEASHGFGAPATDTPAGGAAE